MAPRTYSRLWHRYKDSHIQVATLPVNMQKGSDATPLGIMNFEQSPNMGKGYSPNPFITDPPSGEASSQGLITKTKSTLKTVCGFIIANELCERMAYYGLAGSIVLFMTSELGMSTADADFNVRCPLFVNLLNELVLFVEWLRVCDATDGRLYSRCQMGPLQDHHSVYLTVSSWNDPHNDLCPGTTCLAGPSLLCVILLLECIFVLIPVLSVALELILCEMSSPRCARLCLYAIM